MLLGADQLARRIAARTLFEGVTFQVRAGDRLALVGPNGAGKSTLLGILAGEDSADDGRVSRARGARVGRLRQEIDPGRTHSVREEATAAVAHLAELEAELRTLEAEMSAHGQDGGDVAAELAERYDLTHNAFEHGGGFEREARVESVLAGLGFDEEARGRPLSSFSGGWLMRVELAKLLLSDPDVLLLDEPTNHLDLPAIQWFEETLSAFRGGVVVVSHDRTFLRRHALRIAELDGLGHFTLYESGYDRYLRDRDELRVQLEARKRNQDRQIADMERFVERFRAKATKAKQAQSRIKALEKMERIELPAERRARMRMRIPKPARAGEVVIRLSDVHKRYGDTEVYSGVDLELQRGDRLALVGPNGAGKTTLLRILAGVLGFDSGHREPGHNVEVAFYAQHQLEVLDPARSVLQELEAGATIEDVPRLRGHLGAFLFSGDDVDKKVSVLSGGEKARLALAKMLLRPANFLVLDEPTNHLDIESCEILEEALQSYAGTIVLISHDRAFINALANKVIEVKGGQLAEFKGNYDDYLGRSEENASPSPAAAEPATQTAGPRASKADRQQERERRKVRERTARQVDRVEQEILEREGAIEALVQRQGDPDVARDAERLQALEAEKAAIREEVATRYREWERLADELAALDDAP